MALSLVLSRFLSFLAYLLQAIDGAMSLALCPQVVSQAPQHFRSSEKLAEPLVRVALPAGVSARSFPFTLTCPERMGEREREGLL